MKSKCLILVLLAVISMPVMAQNCIERMFIVAEAFKLRMVGVPPAGVAATLQISAEDLTFAYAVNPRLSIKYHAAYHYGMCYIISVTQEMRHNPDRLNHGEISALYRLFAELMRMQPDTDAMHGFKAGYTTWYLRQLSSGVLKHI